MFSIKAKKFHCNAPYTVIKCPKGSPLCLCQNLYDEDDFRNHAVFYSSIKPLCGFLVGRNRSFGLLYNFYAKVIQEPISSIKTKFATWKNNLRAGSTGVRSYSNSYGENPVGAERYANINGCKRASQLSSAPNA